MRRDEEESKTYSEENNVVMTTYIVISRAVADAAKTKIANGRLVDGTKQPVDVHEVWHPSIPHPTVNTIKNNG